jgi:hypothetical protein
MGLNNTAAHIKRDDGRGLTVRPELVEGLTVRPELVEVSYSKAFQRRAGILKIDLFFNIHKKP